jgi:hypothetical protein
MRLPPPEICAAAIRASEARLNAASETRHSTLHRYRHQAELIRKAWQVVLCARWEAQLRRELPGPVTRNQQSKPNARRHGTA